MEIRHRPCDPDDFSQLKRIERLVDPSKRFDDRFPGGVEGGRPQCFPPRIVELSRIALHFVERKCERSLNQFRMCALKKVAQKALI
jgi:hypothetical protein